jgi:hypothetical protein
VTIHANYGTKTPNRFGKGPLFSACYQQIFWEHPKTFFSFLEEFFGGARKSEIVKKVFLRGRPPYSAAGGGAERWIFLGIFDKIGSSVVV